ncbi:hypothetical protein QJQ45_028609, partial [Haematococcus lacustris]
ILSYAPSLEAKPSRVCANGRAFSHWPCSADPHCWLPSPGKPAQPCPAQPLLVPFPIPMHVVLHCCFQAHCATEQRLQAVLEEHAREKLDWQQQHHDWQQRQQDWQQQQLDWQRRQQDWQQQQQLLEKQLHDLLQRADLHAHIIAVEAMPVNHPHLKNPAARNEPNAKRCALCELTSPAKNKDGFVVVEKVGEDAYHGPYLIVFGHASV